MQVSSASEPVQLGRGPDAVRDGLTLPLDSDPRDRGSYAALVVQFAVKDFKIRYTHSVLGYAWSVLTPLMFFVLYYLVFTVFVHLDIPNYPAFLLLGVVLWNFFEEGTARGAASLVERANLLAKTPMPRAVCGLPPRPSYWRRWSPGSISMDACGCGTRSRKCRRNSA